MPNVTVVVKRDMMSGVSATGYNKSVPADIRVVGMELVPDGDYKQDTVNQINLLKLHDPEFGFIWVNETIVSFAQKVNVVTNANPEIIKFTIGSTSGAPASLATQYVNAKMKFATALNSTIEKNGAGVLAEGVDYNFIAGGGFQLLGGVTFFTGEQWTITLF